MCFVLLVFISSVFVLLFQNRDYRYKSYIHMCESVPVPFHLYGYIILVDINQMTMHYAPEYSIHTRSTLNIPLKTIKLSIDTIQYAELN